MFKRKLNIVLALAVSAILLSITVSAGEQVTRPYKAQSHATEVVNLLSGEWVMHEWGEGTHTGRYTSVGSGYYTDPPWCTDGSGSGVATAANGDQIFWTLEQVGGGPIVVSATGGTGRFENASGVITLEIVELEVVIVWPTMTITATVEYTGWIRY